MCDYNNLLIRHLSTEGVKKDNDAGLAATPDGDVQLSVKVGDEDGEVTVAMRDLDGTIASLRRTSTLAVESHLPALASKEMITNKQKVSNFVVNGVFLPDYILSDKSDIKVHVIDRTKRLHDLEKSVIYYVMDDVMSVEIVKELDKLGYHAVDNPLDLASMIDKLRIEIKQRGDF